MATLSDANRILRFVLKEQCRCCAEGGGHTYRNLLASFMRERGHDIPDEGPICNSCGHFREGCPYCSERATS